MCSQMQLQASLCTLPVEIIHYIFRYLDVNTIIRSFRSVCKRFYTIVKTYDQFNFNFDSSSKSDFLFFCNLVPLQNVEILVLSDKDETPGQIEYFLSFIRIKHFAGLRALTLLEISDCHLNIILKDIKTLSLQSLCIYSQQNYAQNDLNIDQLSLAIFSTSLRELKLNIPHLNLSQIPWFTECRIRHLEIYCRTLDDYCIIIDHLPNLQKFVVLELNEYQYNTDESLNKLSNSKACNQLSSLTFKYCNIDMILLESLLVLAPSLQHLQLIRSLDIHRFLSSVNHFVEFIKEKLLSLDKFEFFIIENQQNSDLSMDAESIIAPFRTSFWIETKKWFVICDYISYQQTFILYTSSTFDPQFEYIYESKEIQHLTTVPSVHKILTMKEVRRLTLDLTTVVSAATSSQGGLSNNILFPQLDNLTISIGYEWPLGSLRVLSTLIDLSHLDKLLLKINDSFVRIPKWTNHLNTLLKLTSNIRSLTVFLHTYQAVHDQAIDICYLVPKHVKHFTMSVSSVYQMQMILRHMKSKSSIKFQYTNTDYNFSDMHLTWFEEQQGCDTFRLTTSSLCIWLDKYRNL